MGANAIVAIPMAVIIGVFSPNIMELYGSDFEHDYVPMVVAVMTAALLSIQAPIGHLLAASSRMWLGALMNLVWAVVYVGLAYLLANKGAVGIMVALGIGYAVHSIWTFRFVWWYLTAKNELK